MFFASLSKNSNKNEHKKRETTQKPAREEYFYREIMLRKLLNS